MSADAVDEQWVTDPRFELRELRRPDFPVLRKGGLDPGSVDAYLDRIERLGDQFLKFTRELEARIAHAKAEASDARRTEHKAVDAAMLAAIEAKHRILTEAGERAWEIEEEARRRADALLSAGPAAVTATSDARAMELENRIDTLEQELRVWRSKASRLEQDAQRHAGFLAGSGESSTPERQPAPADPLASEILAKAEAEAAALLATARTEAADTKESAAGILGRARSQAGAIVTAARAEAARILEEVSSDREAAAAARFAAEAESNRINAEAAELAAARADDILAGAGRSAAEVLGEAKSEALVILDAAEHRRRSLLVEATAAATAEADRILDSARTEADLMMTSAREAIRDAQLSALPQVADTELEAQRMIEDARRRAAENVAEAESMTAGARAAMQTSEASQVADAEVEAQRIVEDARRRAAEIVAEAESMSAGAREAMRTSEASQVADAELAAQRMIDDARRHAAEIVAAAEGEAAEGRRLLEEAHASRASTASILAQAKDAVRRSIVEARQTVIDAQDEAGRILEAARTRADHLPAGQPVDG
jgi:cell division septum initiation protein DivIVA